MPSPKPTLNELMKSIEKLQRVISDKDRDIENLEYQAVVARSNFDATSVHNVELTEENVSLRAENEDLSGRLVMFEEDKLQETNKLREGFDKEIADASRKGENAQEFYKAVIDLGALEISHFKFTTERGSAEFTGMPFRSILTSLFGLTVKDPAQLFNVEKQVGCQLWITEIGPKKIQVIKTVREITGLGLKEAKELVDSVVTQPQHIYTFDNNIDAMGWLAKIKQVGADAELR